MRLDTDASFMGESAFTAMIEGIREAAVEAGMIDSAVSMTVSMGCTEPAKRTAFFATHFLRLLPENFDIP
jgi:hypothetical protein